MLDSIPAQIASALQDSALEVRGELGKIAVFHTLGMIKPDRILVAGTGADITPDAFRIASAHIARKIRDMGLSEFAIRIPPDTVCDVLASTGQIVEGARLALSEFNQYKTAKSNASRPPRLVISSDSTAAMTAAVRRADIISDAVISTRNTANLPPNDCTPLMLADMARKMAGGRTKCTVVSKSALAKGGFGGIMAVGKGSRNDPCLVILEYRGGPARQKPAVLVGKAVTFDTGGISLKPGDRMDEMKFDKCGGCTVLGILQAAAALKLKQNIVGLIPSVENMPGGESYRPGDIIRLYGGKTVEILNTDAEGRLILADALSYAEQHYSPRLIIDFATLTGACIVALGNDVAGMISNSTPLAESLYRSSVRTAEPVWRLPLEDNYARMIKSDVADIKNMGIARSAGTIVAAAFLQEAIKDTPWAHFDIAGVAWTQQATTPKPYNPKGATGFGVRLVMDYLTSADSS